MGASRQLLVQDKRLVVFPLLSGIARALAQSALQTICQAAIYRYAANGVAPAGFDDGMIAEAFREKPTNKWL